jgi:hypothetical protein
MVNIDNAGSFAFRLDRGPCLHKQFREPILDEIERRFADPSERARLVQQLKNHDGPLGDFLRDIGIIDPTTADALNTLPADLQQVVLDQALAAALRGDALHFDVAVVPEGAPLFVGVSSEFQKSYLDSGEVLDSREHGSSLANVRFGVREAHLPNIGPPD